MPAVVGAVVVAAAAAVVTGEVGAVVMPGSAAVGAVVIVRMFHDPVADPPTFGRLAGKGPAGGTGRRPDPHLDRVEAWAAAAADNDPSNDRQHVPAVEGLLAAAPAYRAWAAVADNGLNAQM